MKRTVRKFLSASVLALVLFVVVSCFSCTRATVQYGNVERDYEPNIAGRVTLTTLIAGQTEESRLSIRAFAKAFEAKYPDAAVTVDISINGQADTATRISAGDIGDVFFFWEEDTYKYAITHNALMNLTQYVEPLGIDLGNIYSGTMDLGRINGNIYMVARDHTHETLFYNQDAIEAAGLPKPQDDWTWDEFKDYCQKLTIVGDDGVYEQVGAQIGFDSAPTFIALLQGWGGVWADTVNKRIDLTSEEVVKGVGEVLDMMSMGYIVPIGATGEVASRFSKVNGSIIKCVITPGVFPNFASRSDTYDSYGVNWDCVSWFAYPHRSVGAGATGYGVYNRTKNPDTAAALALFLYTEDGQRAYNGQVGGSVPNVRSLALDDFWRVGSTPDKNYDAFVSYPDDDVVGKFECRVPPEIAEILRNGVSNIFSRHFSGKADYRDTMAQIEQQANEKWQKIYGS